VPARYEKSSQTTDGYIWIGTEADSSDLMVYGLFHGVRDRGTLSSTYIIALRGARDGRPVVGTDEGGPMAET